MVWAAGPASGWKTEGVFHDAGVVERTPGHFCKLNYQDSPFFQPIDDISEDSASARYVELIRATEATWPDLCRAFLESRVVGADTATTEGDEQEYVRARTPDLTLVRRHGSECTLLELSAQRPVLLVFMPTQEVARTTTCTLLPHWNLALPDVDVVPVAHESFRAAPPATFPGVTLFDRDGHAAKVFGARGTGPTAVLLGADGLLAGGPVRGTDDVAQLVSDIADALGEGQGEEDAEPG